MTSGRASPTTSGREPTVLLVEDNRGDAALVEHAFEDRDLPGDLRTVETGQDALDWLAGRGEHAGAPRPDLLLLDLNLPGRSGIDVLEAVSDSEPVRRLPVVVLTSSKAPGDLSKAYDAGANACVRKPVDPGTFAERVESVVDFWLETAVLPTRDAAADD